MALAWDESYAVGVDEIDTQHRAIFSRFSDLTDACSNGYGSEQLMDTVEFMQNYCKTHFAAEERLAQEFNYPGLPEQITAHRQFEEDMAELHEKARAEGPSSERVIALKGKMIQWLIHHVKNMDGELAAYIKGHRN